MPSMLDDTDLDARWRAGLEAASELGPAATVETRVALHIAKWRRTRVGAGVAALVVIGALIVGVVISFGGTDSTRVRAVERPPGTPIATVAVVSHPDLTLTAVPQTVPAGLIEIDYSTVGGTHALVIDTDHEYNVISGPDFRLTVPRGDSNSAVGRVYLKPGVYRLHCVIPGHEVAGEQVTLTVT